MLRAAGCQIVRAEKKSGTAREGRSVPVHNSETPLCA